MSYYRELDVCVELLHRHPLEVNLPPHAILELVALREMRSPDVCDSCRREYMIDGLMRTCRNCGSHYEDQQTAQILKTM